MDKYSYRLFGQGDGMYGIRMIDTSLIGEEERKLYEEGLKIGEEIGKKFISNDVSTYERGRERFLISRINLFKSEKEKLTGYTDKFLSFDDIEVTEDKILAIKTLNLNK